MLLQNDPFRDVDSLFTRFGLRGSGAPLAMPMDAYRRGENVWVHIDLPGVAADSVDISVERGVLTVTAERNWHRQEGDTTYLTERPRGSFRRQVHLGENLDAEHIEADLSDGVLTLRIPIAEVAKPRKISVSSHSSSGTSIGSSPAAPIEASAS